MKNQKADTLFKLMSGFSILILLFVFTACGLDKDDSSSELLDSSSIVIEEAVVEDVVIEPINEDDVEKVFESSSPLNYSFSYMGSFVADDLGLWTKQGYEDRLDPPEGCVDCYIPFVDISEVESDLSLDEYISGETELMQVGENLYTRFEDAGTVTYYLKEGSTILGFKVFSLENENDDFMNLIASLKFN